MWYIYYNSLLLPARRRVVAGQAGKENMAMGQFGEFFKAKRIALGKTLRQFCLENELDPGNMSKLERGLFTPPQHEKLEEYAKLLGLKEGTDAWYQFFDLAAAEAGKIPQDILTDEEAVKKLPLLFRSLRGKKISDEKLNRLASEIKGPQPKIGVPRAKIVAFCKRHHIRKLSLFGSVLRDDFRPDSDVDILVEFEPGHTPGLAFFGMQDELSQILGRKVDLHTPGFLSRYFRARVLAEAKTQYEKTA